MGDDSDKENICHYCDIFRGEPIFDENCTAMAKLQPNI